MRATQSELLTRSRDTGRCRSDGGRGGGGGGCDSRRRCRRLHGRCVVAAAPIVGCRRGSPLGPACVRSVRHNTTHDNSKTKPNPTQPKKHTNNNSNNKNNRNANNNKKRYTSHMTYTNKHSTMRTRPRIQKRENNKNPHYTHTHTHNEQLPRRILHRSPHFGLGRVHMLCKDLQSAVLQSRRMRIRQLVIFFWKTKKK